MRGKRSETGASAPEMALILLLIVVVAFSAVRLFGFQVGDMWRDIADETGGVHSPAPDDGNGGGGGHGNTGGGGSGIPGVPDDTTTTSSTTTTTLP